MGTTDLLERVFHLLTFRVFSVLVILIIFQLEARLFVLDQIPSEYIESTLSFLSFVCATIDGTTWSSKLCKKEEWKNIQEIVAEFKSMVHFIDTLLPGLLAFLPLQLSLSASLHSLFFHSSMNCLQLTVDKFRNEICNTIMYEVANIFEDYTPQEELLCFKKERELLEAALCHDNLLMKRQRGVAKFLIQIVKNSKEAEVFCPLHEREDFVQVVLNHLEQYSFFSIRRP